MTSHRKLLKPLISYRIGDANGRYPIFSSVGASLHPGRWSNIGQKVIYATKYYSTALLEKLVYLGELPDNHHYIEITIPKGATYTEITADTVDGWYLPNMKQSRAFARTWHKENQPLILIVPSVITRLDKNVIINANHEEFKSIEISNEIPVKWESRLFE